MELLGETTLERLPLVLSGSRAVESSAQAADHVREIATARQLLKKLFTRRAVQLAVSALNAEYEARLRDGLGKFNLDYRIDPRTLTFTALPGQEVPIREAKAYLQRGTSATLHGYGYPSAEDVVARLKVHTTPVDVPLRLTGVPFLTAPQHDLTYRPDQNLSVSLADLERTARRLDAIDALPSSTWAPEGWHGRLTQVLHLHRRTPTGLEATDTLDLQGLKHLIGLPGAGKTTLISLLCVYLAAQGKRVCVFFTSIEMAREYLERLRRYDTPVTMLVGSSGRSRQTHGERLAELIAVQGDGGFGHTQGGADLFAQTCPLPAFAVEESQAWDHWDKTEAPCEDLYTEGSKTRHLCPLWSRCGRVKNQRDLVTANVWLGHIRSADTQVPAHTSRERLSYFELIARTFDLVIVDEVDETQRSLDALGAVSLSFGGSSDSVHRHAQEITNLAMTGRLSVHDPALMYRYQHAANNFERHLLRFHEEISTFEQNDLGLALQNRLLTTNYLINRAVDLIRSPAEPPIDPGHLSAIYAFWDSALYTAYFRKDQRDQRELGVQRRPWARLTQMAEGLDLSEEETERRWTLLQSTMRDYMDSLDQSPDLSEELRSIEEQFAMLVAPGHTQQLAPLARLTTTVGFTIAAYQNLVRMTRPLSQYDVLPEAVRAKVSPALENRVARNLLGTFSSVRYQKKEEGGFDISYLILDTAPRLLLQRLHEQGCNVLLTSATSWMPDSTAFHVSVKPDYVLKPRTAENIRLRLRFQPIKHPTRKDMLRYSGAGTERDENLRLMVLHLARLGVNNLSPLDRASRNMATPLKRPRMCALVVNSYPQVQQVVREIARSNPELAARTRGVLKKMPESLGTNEHYVLRGQVETLGHDDEVTVVVFPLQALGRGVNIVFRTDDADNGTAAIGNVYFLIRPHPTVDDLSLMISNVARQTEMFDQQRFPDQTLLEVQGHYLEARKKLYASTMNLLSRSMSASRLPEIFLKPFAANLLIPILQTIGRAIRRSRPAEVFFVDAAWAPKSAAGDADDERSSVLVGMQDLLSGYLTDTDPGERAVMDALFGPFAAAFDDIEGLRTGGYSSGDEEGSDYPPVYLDDEGDLDQYE